MGGFTEKALFFIPLKTPPLGRGEEEPGVLMQQHPALPALRSALSDKRARRNRHGEHSQRHANGHCLFFLFVCFFIKNTKAPTTSSSFRCSSVRSRAVVLLQLCSSLLLHGTALSSRWQFELWGFFYCRDRI